MSWRKRVAAFGFAFRGLGYLFATQVHARFHLVATVGVVTGGFLFRISPTEWLAVCICLGLVLSLEAVNTAIEELVNLVSPHHHPIAGKVKDLSAGAVLLAALAAAAVAAIVFLPKFYAAWFSCCPIHDK